MLDPETQREIILLKTQNLGIDAEDIEALDEVVCKVLGIEDPEPLILEI